MVESKSGIDLIIKDSIRTWSNRIFNWLKNLDKRCKEWHPDRVRCIKETGGLDEGDIVVFEEYIHGDSYKLKVKVTKIEANKKIEYRFLFLHQ